nr:hypothetical protein [uncultured Halomonas sp.]
MKTLSISALVFAAILPVGALASVASDQAFRAIHEPLAPKTSSIERTSEQPRALIALGQSDGVAQTFHNIARETDHVTELPGDDDNAPTSTRPLDW